MGLYRRLYGLSTFSLRLANVYGPRQDPKGEAGVIAIYCGAAVDGGRATVYGDGLQTRDFVYVGDVVEAFMAAGDSDARRLLQRVHGPRDDGARARRGARPGARASSPSAPARCAARAWTRRPPAGCSAGAPGRRCAGLDRTVAARWPAARDAARQSPAGVRREASRSRRLAHRHEAHRVRLCAEAREGHAVLGDEARPCPPRTKGCERSHSRYWKHCSLSAKSKSGSSAATWSRSFLSPMESPRAWAARARKRL